MSSQSSIVIEPEEKTISEDNCEPKRVAVSTVLCRISQFWPFRFAMRAFRGFWWLFGFSTPEKPLAPAEGDSPARTCRTGRKRLWRATRMLLAFVPCRVQSAFGYPVCTSIGRTVSPEVQSSPTKPCGKGSKRKQDDVDDDEEDVEEQSWVEALNQELADEDAADPEDPDYEPTSINTDSDEYRTHNNTESDIEVEKGVVVIKDVEIEIEAVETDVAPSDS
ncbi:oogenesis-related [Clupea harengus]|uniref:Oogenesis-related n=1 Tax=Clupea harengus TaxID=7950 RepID=A0A6P8FRK4_CLUHA|nr:oogenesis-related [Clupea harengus]